MEENSYHDEGGKESGYEGDRWALRWVFRTMAVFLGWEGSIIDEFLVSTNITYRGGMMNHFHEKFKRSHIIGIQVMILLEDHSLIRPYYRSIWSRMHKEIWGSVFLTWSRKIWKAEDFHAFPCGIFTSTSAQMLNPILRKEKVHVYRNMIPKILTWSGWTVQNHSVTYLQPFFFTGKDAPTGGAFADFGTRTENKTSQMCSANLMWG